LANKKLVDSYNGAQRNVLIRLSGAYRTTPHLAMTVIIASLPTSLDAIKKAAKYWLKKKKKLEVKKLLGRHVEDISALQEVIIEKWQATFKC